MLDNVLDHPKAFLCVCLGLAIVLYSMRKAWGRPLGSAREIWDILSGEFDSIDGRKTPLEKLDAFIIYVLCMLTVILFFAETLVYLLQRHLSEVPSAQVPILTMISLGAAIAACVISPTWVYLQKRQTDADEFAIHMAQAVARDFGVLLPSRQGAGAEAVSGGSRWCKICQAAWRFTGLFNNWWLQNVVMAAFVFLGTLLVQNLLWPHKTLRLPVMLTVFLVAVRLFLNPKTRYMRAFAVVLELFAILNAAPAFKATIDLSEKGPDGPVHTLIADLILEGVSWHVNIGLTVLMAILLMLDFYERAAPKAKEKASGTHL